MKLKPLTLFLCALTLILLAISPLMLSSYFYDPAKPVAFRGILTLWHISDWRTGGSSSAAFLQKRIKEFEKQHPYVFVELISLSSEKAHEAILCGERPDMISYSSSFDAHLPLTVLPPQSPQAVCSSGANAYPYMFGGYFAIVNTELMSEHNIEAPDDWGIRPEILTEAAQHGIAFTSEEGYSALPALALHTYPELDKPNITTWGSPDPPDAALNMTIHSTETPVDTFCRGEVCVLIASHRQLFDISEAYQQGNAPNHRAYALSGYTDMAQLISVVSSENALRESICRAFAVYITSESAQQKTTALNAFAAAKGLDLYEDCADFCAAYHMFCDTPAYVSRNRAEQINTLALEALAGDERSLRQLRKMLRSDD